MVCQHGEGDIDSSAGLAFQRVCSGSLLEGVLGSLLEGVLGSLPEGVLGESSGRCAGELSGYYMCTSAI